MTNKSPAAVLTKEELDALLAGSGEERVTPQDPERFWFVARSLVVLAFLSANLFSVLFRTDTVLSRFDLPAGMERMIVTEYLPLRIATVAVLIAVYVAARLGRRLFSTVSAFVIAAAALNLLNDWVVLFSFAKPSAWPMIYGTVAARIGMILCLVLNHRSWERSNPT